MEVKSPDSPFPERNGSKGPINSVSATRLVRITAESSSNGDLNSRPISPRFLRRNPSIQEDVSICSICDNSFYYWSLISNYCVQKNCRKRLCLKCFSQLQSRCPFCNSKFRLLSRCLFHILQRSKLFYWFTL